MNSVKLTPVALKGYWRVKLAWPNATPRIFGRFDTKAEAEKWIEKHRWLQHQEPTSRASDKSNDH